MDGLIKWLLEGDIAIQYLTHWHLLNSEEEVLSSLQPRIGTEGLGAKFLACRKENGHWGIWFYQPKWTCTHYTLTDLKNIGMPGNCTACREMVVRAFAECMLNNGAINFAKSKVQSDICIDGMVLNYAAYFCPEEKRIEKLIDYLLSVSMPDGGYAWNESSEQSDPHSTIAVLEGFLAYKRAGFTHRLKEIEIAEKRAIAYFLSNRLFIAADKRYRQLSYPYRYRYDILRVLEYLAEAGVSGDERLQPALEWLKGKRKADGRWYLENIHKGNVHFDLEPIRKPSRFITLKALYILKQYNVLSEETCLCEDGK